LNEPGKILVASDNGTFLLRFVGDVRLTLCVAIDDYLQQMLGDPGFEGVIVDLCQAQGLDSTSLGLLVKLAQETLRQTGRRPMLVNTDSDIQRVLQSVGADDLFERTAAVDPELAATRLAAVKPADVTNTENAMRERILDAHRRLMSLNEGNAQAFKDLVAQLEAVDQNKTGRNNAIAAPERAAWRE